MTAHDHIELIAGCFRCELNADELGIVDFDPYVEVADAELTDEFGLPLTYYLRSTDANPERVNNGCQIYKANQ
jgi:hypothetical protein